jgi:ankyrin repeat protein
VGKAYGVIRNGIIKRANSQDTNNHRPSSEFGHLDAAQLLLDHGADANALDNNNMTPLHLASQCGHLKIVQLLLRRGANHDAREKNARTALHLVFVGSLGYVLCRNRFQFRSC